MAPAEEPRARPSPFRPAPRPPVLHRVVPVTGELGEYRPATGGRDLAAALTVAAVALPAAMGYAEVAGLSPVNGLYALLLPTVAYAFLGSSRQLIVGPDGSLSALVGALVLGTTAAASPKALEIASTLALLVAGFFLLARAARLGWMADYLSRPVLVGYIHGIAVVLIVGQLGKLLGIPVQARNPLPQLAEIVRELGSVSGATLAVSLASLAILLPLRFTAPRVPAALLLVVASIAVSRIADLGAHGVALVGPIPSGLPSLGLDTPSLGETAGLVPAALGLFLLSFADAVLTARTFAGRHGQHIDVGQELLAMGAANAAAGISQGYPVGASGSRTAVNDAAGVRTQVAGLLAAGVVVVVLVLLTGPLADLPKAVLGAVIVTAAIGLINPEAWRALARADRVELAIAGVTTAGVVIVGVLPAIGFAVALSIVDVVRRSARPHDAVLGWVPRLGRYADVALHRSAQVTPGVVVYRVDDRIFFANASYIKARVQEAVHGAATPTRWLVLDAEGVNHIDTAGLEMLRELRARLEDEGTTLVLAHVKSQLRARLEEAGLADELGAANLHPTVRAAVAACTEREPEPALADSQQQLPLTDG